MGVNHGRYRRPPTRASAIAGTANRSHPRKVGIEVHRSKASMAFRNFGVSKRVGRISSHSQTKATDQPANREKSEAAAAFRFLRPTARAIRTATAFQRITTRTPIPCHSTRPHTTATSVVSTNRERRLYWPRRSSLPGSTLSSSESFIAPPVCIRGMLLTGCHNARFYTDLRASCNCKDRPPRAAEGKGNQLTSWPKHR
jgi:hypothetical protein